MSLSDVEGFQGTEEEEDTIVVLKHGVVCVSSLQEEKLCHFISVSLHICTLLVSKKILNNEEHIKVNELTY